MCYEEIGMAKNNLHPLPGNHLVVCTMKHHTMVMKEKSSGNDKQLESGRKGNWDRDSRLRPNNPNTSMKMLLDWFMNEVNYSKFCGKNNDGIKKIQICNHLAAKISAATTTQHNGKNILNKI